jgi:phage tail tape-measure protein
MKRAANLLCVLAVGAGLAGCSNLDHTQQRVLTGGAIGTAAGAALGAMTGGLSIAAGALIGAGVGSATGYIVDQTSH